MTESRSRQRGARMARAQAGDPDAYRALLEELGTALTRFVRRRVIDPDDVADIVQETLVNLHRARHTYDPERPFDPWLFAITRRAMIDHTRRRMRRATWEVTDELLDEHPAPSETAPAERLLDAMHRLPEKQRAAFKMLKLEGLSVEAAAARAGTTPGALKVRAHRAYKALRALLGGGA